MKSEVISQEQVEDQANGHLINSRNSAVGKPSYKDRVSQEETYLEHWVCSVRKTKRFSPQRAKPVEPENWKVSLEYAREMR